MFPSSKSFRGAPLPGSTTKNRSARFLKKPLKTVSKLEFLRIKNKPIKLAFN
jgi:hypothetical protein